MAQLTRELLKNLLKDRVCGNCIFNQNPFGDGRRCYAVVNIAELSPEYTCNNWRPNASSKEWICYPWESTDIEEHYRNVLA